MKTWILVANSAAAKLLNTDSLRVKEPTIIDEFFHPNSRKKGSELLADKPGVYKNDTSGVNMFSKNNPKDVEAEHFAVDLAHEIKKYWDQYRFEKLILVMPAQFYGLLKKHLHFASNLEVLHLTKDYTKYTTVELQQALVKHFFG